MGKNPIKSRPRMVKMIEKQLMLTDFEQILYQPFQKCEQGNRSVANYTEKFLLHELIKMKMIKLHDL